MVKGGEGRYSKSLRALVTRSHKAKAKPSGDSKELALKELESVASALKRATTAVRRKTTAGDKDVEHALKAEGITPQVCPPPMRIERERE
jgi:hypothetical protein